MLFAISPNSYSKVVLPFHAFFGMNSEVTGRPAMPSFVVHRTEFPARVADDNVMKKAILSDLSYKPELAICQFFYD